MTQRVGIPHYVWETAHFGVTLLACLHQQRTKATLVQTRTTTRGSKRVTKGCLAHPFYFLGHGDGRSGVGQNVWLPLAFEWVRRKLLANYLCAGWLHSNGSIQVTGEPSGRAWIETQKASGFCSLINLQGSEVQQRQFAPYPKGIGMNFLLVFCPPTAMPLPLYYFQQLCWQWTQHGSAMRHSMQHSMFLLCARHYQCSQFHTSRSFVDSNAQHTEVPYCLRWWWRYQWRQRKMVRGSVNGGGRQREEGGGGRWA